jgi:hypothetical protein
VLAELRRGADEAEGPGWTIGVDAGVVRAHQHAAGARHQLPRPVGRCGKPSRVTTGGHRHDSLAFAPLMAGIRIGRRGPGRACTRPGRVLADKAYSSRAIRSYHQQAQAHRAVATRYDKRDYVFRGTVDVASIRIWLRDPVR